MTRELIRVFDAVDPVSIPKDPGVFLDTLPGPSLFRRAGRDRSRVRVVVGMLHGNEPSGLWAIHAALTQTAAPATDMVYFLGAVEAARTEPHHSQRMLPGRRDLNRCFTKPAADLDGSIAETAARLMCQRTPEAVLDIHNNTGRNPAYSVCLSVDEARLGLTRLFARLLVQTDYRMGTLMELFEPVCPVVTIEAGHACSSAAHALASDGVRRFAQLDALRDLPSAPSVSVLHDAVRVQLTVGLSLAFSDQRSAADLVFDVDLDRHNFSRLAPGTRLGWLRPGAPWPVTAVDARGFDRARALFEVHDQQLLTRTEMTPVMMTTHPAIAKSDCLFYAVAPSAGGAASG